MDSESLKAKQKELEAELTKCVNELERLQVVKARLEGGLILLNQLLSEEPAAPEKG